MGDEWMDAVGIDYTRQAVAALKRVDHRETNMASRDVPPAVIGEARSLLEEALRHVAGGAS